MSRPSAAKSLKARLDALLAGDRAALAWAITEVENGGGKAAPVLAAIYPKLGRARLVGITGPPGAGKSTLVGAYAAELRRRGQTVGIIAVDPSSPVSGGAILGDRLRMSALATDDGVFVRSLAARGHLGGLSRAAARVIDVMDAAGKDVVVIETVGTGQSEVEIAEVADVKVVVAAPGLGDEVQAIKAGVLEIADILVVNKADSPLADGTVRQLEAMVSMTGRAARVPVLKTTATSGDGLAALADAIESASTGAAIGPARSANRVRRLLAGLAADRARAVLLDGSLAEMDALSDDVLRGKLDFEEASRRALALAAERET